MLTHTVVRHNKALFPIPCFLEQALYETINIYGRGKRPGELVEPRMPLQVLLREGIQHPCSHPISQSISHGQERVHVNCPCKVCTILQWGRSEYLRATTQLTTEYARADQIIQCIFKLLKLYYSKIHININPPENIPFSFKYSFITSLLELSKAFLKVLFC